MSGSDVSLVPRLLGLRKEILPSFINFVCEMLIPRIPIICLIDICCKIGCPLPSIFSRTAVELPRAKRFGLKYWAANEPSVSALLTSCDAYAGQMLPAQVGGFITAFTGGLDSLFSRNTMLTKGRETGRVKLARKNRWRFGRCAKCALISARERSVFLADKAQAETLKLG